MFFCSKHVRKVFFIMAALVFLPALVFAYDGTVVGGSDGNFTRYNWIQQASNANTAQGALLANYLTAGQRIQTFVQLGEDDVDAEDVQVINDLEAYITGNYRVANGEAFSHVVKRGDVNRGWDGWMVFSHYSNTQGWLHYLYYFLIS